MPATPFTDAQWRDRLIGRLIRRRPQLKKYDRYYRGEHDLSFATAKFKEAFGGLFEEFATNWCELVVDVAAERLKVQGFRFGQDDADTDAWNIWQANRLDVTSLMLFTEAIKLETAYLLVGPVPDDDSTDGEPLITVEHPFQCIVEHDPANRLKRLAGLRYYEDTNGDKVAELYLADRIVTWRRAGFVDTLTGLGLQLPTGVDDWQHEDTQNNPVGKVLLVPVENHPDLLTGGTSDLRPAVRLNDAADKFFMDMIVSSEFTGFPQRVLTGVELPRDPETGEVLPSAQLKAALSRVWAFKDPQARADQLEVGDLGNYVAAIDMTVQHMAAQTRTPPHYLLAKLANISADALIAAEAGLESRCLRKHVDYSDSLEEAMRIAFAWRARSKNRNGDNTSATDLERSKMLKAETIWSNPRRQSESALGDALIKKQTVGVPQKQLWVEADYSPEQISRMEDWAKAQQAQETANQAKIAAAAAAAVKPAEPGPAKDAAKPGEQPPAKPVPAKKPSVAKVPAQARK
jgi:hypothetical protein